MKPILIILLAFAACTQPTTKETTTRQSTGAVTATDTVLRHDTVVITKDADPASPDRLIIPGKSIGYTALNEGEEEIRAHLGMPDKMDAAMGKSMATWYSKKGKKDSLIIYYARNMRPEETMATARHIRISSDYFRTREGISVGSSLSEIQKAFPTIKAKATYNQGRYSIYDALKEGIAFEFDEQDRCIAITIHQPNQRAYDTYITFFEDLKWI